MFRSSLYFKSLHIDSLKSSSRLKEKLKKSKSRFSIRYGTVLNYKTKKETGFQFVAIDLCRVNDSKKHIQKLIHRLKIVLKYSSWDKSLFNRDHCECILSITTTNGEEDYFIRRLEIDPELMQLCVKHGITIVADICPCYIPPTKE